MAEAVVQAAEAPRLITWEPDAVRRALITITVILAALLELIDTTIVNVAINTIRGNLGATLGEISWVVAGYSLANAIIVPMTGWLSARFGRRGYFLFSILLFTASSVACGQSTTIWELITFRFIQGLGGGALLATSQSILAEVYPPEQRGLSTAIFGIGAIVGPTVGPFIGGYLTDTYSWPMIFYVNLPIGILAAFLTYSFIPDQKFKQAVGRVDWLGLVLLVAGIGALQTFLERGHEEDWFESRFIWMLGITAVGSLVTFVWHELRTPNPIVNLRILKNRPTAIGMCFTFILGLALYSSLFIYPVFVQGLLHLSAVDSGLSLMPGGLASMVMLPFVAISLRKWLPVRVAVAMGFVLFAVFCYLMSQQTLQSGGRFSGDFFWPQVIRGAGTALLFVPITTVALYGLKGADIAQGAGLNNMMRQIGGSLGIAVMATLVDRQQGVRFAQISEHVSMSAYATRARLDALTAGFAAKTGDVFTAQKQALAALKGTIQVQALHLAYMDAFVWVGLFLLCCIPLLLFLPKVRFSGGIEAGH